MSITKLTAAELRNYEPTGEEVGAIERNNLFIIIDNVLDTFNIGSIFRLADAVAARAIFLVGETATPEDAQVAHRIHKASVGTYRWVAWRHFRTIGEAVRAAKRAEASVRIVAIEQDKRSIDYRQAALKLPLALIVGHETRGVSKEGLELAETIVELPLFGVNKSLNVLVALSIICYKVIEQI